MDGGRRLDGAGDIPQLPGRSGDQPPNPGALAVGADPSSSAIPTGISDVMAKRLARVEDILREKDSARKVRLAGRLPHCGQKR